MTPWGNPDSWMDVLDHVWLGLVFIIVAGVPSWFSLRNHQGIRDIKAQVVNGHTEPMRSDLDRAINAVEDLANDVRGLRADLTAEGNVRRQQFGELRSDLDYRTGKHRKQED